MTAKPEWGDHEAWGRVRTVALRTARRFLGDGAEDVAQEAVICVLLVPEGTPIRNVEAWVTTAARFEALRLLRRQRTALAASVRMEGVGYDYDFEDSLVLAIFIEEMLNGLPERQHATIEALIWRDFDYLTAGKLLGITDNSVKKHRSRALTSIRKALENQLDQGDIADGT